ncbi:unnamed protein product, partial [Rotaria sp. Silwood1]
GNTFISRGSVTCGAICNFVGGRRCSVVGSTASCTGLLVHRDSGGYYDIYLSGSPTACNSPYNSYYCCCT